MHRKINMFFFKKKKDKPIEYSKHLFEHIIKNILDETIDRKILFELMRQRLKPIVGKDVIQQFLLEINRIEKQSDKKKIEYWMNRAHKADKDEVFD